MRSIVSFVMVTLVGIGMLLAPARRATATPPTPPPIAITVSFGPPAIPYYTQPFCPGPGYIWVPGYWAWDPYYGYYWVPGTWVLAPYAGALWTPGYWGWDPAMVVFVWHPGYWGPMVGFYGGINYGYGYPGEGYYGGYWRGRDFYYNRAVNNINVTNIRYVYNRTVVVNNMSRVSYNGGRGGIVARPTPNDEVAYRERRFGPIGDQNRQMELARANPNLRASFNHGRPEIAATPRPGVFSGQGVVRAERAGGIYRQPPVNRGRAISPGRRAPNNAQGGWQHFGQAPQAGRVQAAPQQRRPGYRHFGEAPNGGGNGGNAQPRSYGRAQPRPQGNMGARPNERQPQVQRQQTRPQRQANRPAPQGRGAPRNQQNDRGNGRGQGSGGGRR